MFDEDLVFVAFASYRSQLPVLGLGGLVEGLNLIQLGATEILALIMLGAVSGIEAPTADDDFKSAMRYLGYPACLEPDFYQGEP